LVDEVQVVLDDWRVGLSAWVWLRWMGMEARRTALWWQIWCRSCALDLFLRIDGIDFHLVCHGAVLVLVSDDERRGGW
jgi:hypothetical protein